MYPIGLTSIAEYLERAGYRVRIVNLAVRMMRDKNFNAEEMIKRLKAPVFGIDLHWMVHCHGAIEIARLVKKYHPESKLVFGGFSSSYFYGELIGYPEIDYIIRGDSTEEPIRQLMDCITKGEEPEAVPNLVWRDSQGRTRENPFSNIPSDLSNVMVKHYDGVIRSIFRYRDLVSYLPFKDWLRYPITAVITCRGCTHNCIICGGSAAAFKRIHQREKPVFRTPESVVRDVKQIERFSRGPIFILGDLLQAGEDYAYETLRLLQKDRVKNQLIFELFAPASGNLIHQIGLASPNFCLEISPESHDPEIRKIVGEGRPASDAKVVGHKKVLFGQVRHRLGTNGFFARPRVDGRDNVLEAHIHGEKILTGLGIQRVEYAQFSHGEHHLAHFTVEGQG